MQHFQVNFYANGWFVNKTGSFNIVIKYELQKVLDIGLLISGFSTVDIVSLIIIPPFIKRVKKPKVGQKHV